jgi:hypothetical protein
MPQIRHDTDSNSPAHQIVLFHYYSICQCHTSEALYVVQIVVSHTIPYSTAVTFTAYHDQFRSGYTFSKLSSIVVLNCCHNGLLLSATSNIDANTCRCSSKCKLTLVCFTVMMQ